VLFRILLVRVAPIPTTSSQTGFQDVTNFLGGGLLSAIAACGGGGGGGSLGGARF
jgi:hypothetical protein